jgi:hypothetical protein
MIIHTSAAEADLCTAARIARVTFDRFVERGSRTHARAFNVTLTGESRRMPNGGRSGGYQYGADNDHAATWDQWGVFLAAIFDADPNAKMTYYKDADDFHWQTDDRFKGGWPADAHGDHAWEYAAPYTQACKRCSAVKRWHA